MSSRKMRSFLTAAEGGLRVLQWVSDREFGDNCTLDRCVCSIPSNSTGSVEGHIAIFDSEMTIGLRCWCGLVS